MPRKRRPMEQRFWAHVAKSQGCWLWTASVNVRWGYGQFMVLADEPPYFRQMPARANRIAWFLEMGSLPAPPLMILHRCHVRRCVRPSHLYVGTATDNMRDRVNVGNCPRGKDHWNARLSDVAVRHIRAAHRAGSTMAALARKFRVCHETVRAVLAGRTWRHVV